MRGAIVSLIFAAVLWFIAMVLDRRGKPYLAAALGGAGMVFFLLMLGLLANRGTTAPVPSATPAAPALPSHGPACVDLAWLDERWTCVPADQAG